MPGNVDRRPWLIISAAEARALLEVAQAEPRASEDLRRAVAVLRNQLRWLRDGSYGTWEDDFIELKPPVERTDRGIRSRRVFQEDALNTLRDSAIDQFVARMQTWPEDLARDFAPAGRR